jgi:hypothetical protein
MTAIQSYLTIAGIAHRRTVEVRSEIEANPTAFPIGPDDTHLVQEIAICEAIIASVTGLLSAQMLQLEFTHEERARAVAPPSLKEGDYDQGTHEEPAQ